MAHEPVAFADGKLSFADPRCPTTTDDGTTVTITGECVDARGVSRFGSATLVRGPAGARPLTLQDHGDDAFIGPERGTGTVTITELATDEPRTRAS